MYQYLFSGVISYAILAFPTEVGAYVQCAVYACGLLGRLTGEKRAVCSTCPEQRGVLCYCTWPNDQLRIELLSSCLVLGCSEHSQLPDSMRATTFCQFELILSILITSISGIRLRKCILDTGPVTKTAVWYLLQKNNTFFFFFPKLTL